MYIADIAAEIDIPADGTLSRVLHSDTTVRVVGFGFDRGQELTEHTASRPAIVQVISGRLTVESGGDTHQMGPGSWLLIPANEPHSVVATEPTVMLLTLVKGP